MYCVLTFSDGADEYMVNKFLYQLSSIHRWWEIAWENLFIGKLHLASLIWKKRSCTKMIYWLYLFWQVMLTVLTQLELGEVRYLHLLPALNVTCTLNFHNAGSKNVLRFLIPQDLTSNYCHKTDQLMVEYGGTCTNADIPSFACCKWCCCCCNSEKVSLISGFDHTKQLNTRLHQETCFKPTHA